MSEYLNFFARVSVVLAGRTKLCLKILYTGTSASDSWPRIVERITLKTKRCVGVIIKLSNIFVLNVYLFPGGK